MRTTYFISLVFSAGLTACLSKPGAVQKTSVSVDEAYALTQKGVLLVDVREPDEVAAVAYRVKNYRNIPLSQLESRLGEIPQDRPVVLACRSGGRSQRAYEMLTARGFRNVINMEGGLLAWEAHNLPVVRRP